MNSTLALQTDPFDAISPFEEMGAYESLWLREKASFKIIADRVRDRSDILLSQLVSSADVQSNAEKARHVITKSGVARFGVHVRPDSSYPSKLLDAEHPVELLYYIGNWDLVYTPSVAIVGTRHPTEEGKARARRIARLLVEDGYTVVSGLAAGIDREAHQATIEAGGQTIAVLGTSIAATYPRENAELQARIAEEYLVLSQVPILRYDQQGAAGNRLFFPERNVTMSAITKATIIVEAGETSGTLIQARAAIKQKRKLFILDSCFQNPNLTWPRRFEEQGAIRVRHPDDIRNVLGRAEEANTY